LHRCFTHMCSDARMEICTSVRLWICERESLSITPAVSRRLRIGSRSPWSTTRHVVPKSKRATEKNSSKQASAERI
jgi:hypothetical protein